MKLIFVLTCRYYKEYFIMHFNSFLRYSPKYEAEWNLIKTFKLKELRNRILRAILAWSLFCLTRLYVGLHFLRFLLEN